MNTRKYSSKQEKIVAKSLQGRVQPNSGATPFMKGDVVTDNWLVECKTQLTNKKSITIKKEWLDKLEEERFAMRKQYKALAFNFGPGENNFYILDDKTFNNLRRTENEEK